MFRPDLVSGKSDRDAGRTFMTPALCGPEFHRSKGSSPQAGARLDGEAGDRSRVFSAIARVSNAGAVKEPSNGGDAHVAERFRSVR